METTLLKQLLDIHPSLVGLTGFTAVRVRVVVATPWGTCLSPKFAWPSLEYYSSASQCGETIDVIVPGVRFWCSVFCDCGVQSGIGQTQVQLSQVWAVFDCEARLVSG